MNRSRFRERPCLVRSAEDREQHGPPEVRRAWRAALAYLFERPQCLVGRTRTENERPVEPGRPRGRVTGEPAVVELTLGRFGVLVITHSEVRAVCKDAPEQSEPPRVAALVLERQRSATDLIPVFDAGRTIAAVGPYEERRGASEHGTRAIAHCLSTLGNYICALGGRMPIDIDHVPHHLELEREVEVERALELDRAR